MSGRRVFRLFACCVPVRGARRSTLCDLQRQRYDLVPNGLIDVLERYGDHTLEEIKADFPANLHATLDEYFGFLVKQEYGFWCDDPDAFPPLDLTWERPELVTNAVIDVDARSRHDWPSLLAQLDALGCQALQVRFFRPAPLEELDAVLGQMARGRLRSVELLLPHDPAWGERTLEELCLRHQRVMGIVVHSAPETHVERVGGLDTVIFHRTEVVDSHAHCGLVGPEWFVPSLEGFAEARAFNSCLNRKLSVDAAGEIRNCPSLRRSFGNAAQVPLRAAVEDPAFRALWGITKDQVETCRDCEFRYLCTDCRAFVRDPADPLSKPAKCSYDPYAARWN
ncbi:MAG TPA: grasp-with-spasm system SPASM domain peptide maturase [Longimicrobiaceae bacterium]|nr:grasp-with-spasm system SPASM domain peptide maturase [Longimicrobiaceae bacterium]